MASCHSATRERLSCCVPDSWNELITEMYNQAWRISTVLGSTGLLGGGLARQWIQTFDAFAVFHSVFRSDPVDTTRAHFRAHYWANRSFCVVTSSQSTAHAEACSVIVERVDMELGAFPPPRLPTADFPSDGVLGTALVGEFMVAYSSSRRR